MVMITVSLRHSNTQHNLMSSQQGTERHSECEEKCTPILLASDMVSAGRLLKYRHGYRILTTDASQKQNRPKHVKCRVADYKNRWDIHLPLGFNGLISLT
jgi:hypothetical protein